MLADITVKATLVLAAAWIGTRAARRAPAAARHLIWMISLGTLLLLPVLEAVAPRRTLISIPSETVVATEHPPVVVDTPLTANAPTGDYASVSLDLTAAQPVPASSTPGNLVIWVGGAWAAGCAVVLFSALIGWFALNRIKARTLPLPPSVSATGGGRRVQLKVSREGRPPSALTWGAWRPTILLPRAAEEWPHERLETVLLHELEHVRRWDAAMQLIGIAACALYWFHPGAWLAAKAARSEAEAATDDAVLRRGVRPSAYANTLMEVAAEIGRRPHLVSPTGVAFMKKSKIEARLRAILDGRTRRGVTRTEKAVAITLAIAILVPLAFVRAAAVAPFAALPDNSDPFVSIHVTPRQQTPKKLSKKQLAAQRAHHLRALAMRDRLAALQKAAADLALHAQDRSGLTAEQAKQALDAGQLTQDLGQEAQDNMRSKGGTLSRDQLAERDAIIAGIQLDAAQSRTKGSSDARIAEAKDLMSRLNAKNMDPALAASLTSQLDAKSIASTVKISKMLTSQQDARGLTSTLEMVKSLTSQLDAKLVASSQEMAKSLTAQLDAKGVASALSITKSLTSQLEAKGLEPARMTVMASQMSADALASARAAQKADPSARQDAFRQKIEVERTVLDAQKAALKTLQEQVRTLQIEESKLEAQAGSQKGQRDMLRQKLLAMRAAMAGIQAAQRRLGDARLHSYHNPFTSDPSMAGLKEYAAAKRAQRDALNKQMRAVYRTRMLNGYNKVYTANQRKAMLERERAALVARLKAIEAELGRKGK